MKMAEHCQGKWSQIIASLIGPDFTQTNKHSRCPKNGEGTDRFRFSDVNDRGNYFCACSEGDKDGFELLMCVKGWDFKQCCEEIESVIGKCPKNDGPPPKKQKTIVERLQGQVLDHVKSSRYLQNRGLEIAPGLKWIKSLDFYHEGEKRGRFPAMLAPVKRDGKVLTYHATYILDDGRDKMRKILPSPTSLQGSAVELYPITGDELGVAEGVETAIAAKMLYGMPVWSVLNTALMKSWKPPSNIKTVHIFGDNDYNYAGHAAAYGLGHRLKKMNEVEVTISFPPEKGQDFNDLLLQNT